MKCTLTLGAHDMYFYSWIMQMTEPWPQQHGLTSKGSLKQSHGHLVDIVLTHRLLDICQFIFGQVPKENVEGMRLTDVFHKSMRAPSLETSVEDLKKAVSKNVKYNKSLFHSFIVPQVDWSHNQDWIRMLKDCKEMLEGLETVEKEDQMDRMLESVIEESVLEESQTFGNRSVVNNNTGSTIGSRILRSILLKYSTARSYSMIVNIEGAAFHILYLLEKVS